MGRPFSVKRKNHIKYAFLLKDTSCLSFSLRNTHVRYLIGYLTDDNKILFDEFMLDNKPYFKRSTIRIFLRKLMNRFIDSRTKVYHFFGDGRDYTVKDVIYLLWSIYHNAMKFHMLKLSLGQVTCFLLYRLGIISTRPRKQPKSYKYNEALKRLDTIYDSVLASRVCPWINDTATQRLKSTKFARRRMYKVVMLTLYYIYLSEFMHEKARQTALENKLKKSTLLKETEEEQTKENTNGEDKRDTEKLS